jgi:predicted unusual protein kinase regulating ubiquinone biosynthesis (AarF/ABC1/UbiB family)
MAQRADLIGKEAARSLKALQSSNQPFPDELAWQIILNDLGTTPIPLGHLHNMPYLSV